MPLANPQGTVLYDDQTGQMAKLPTQTSLNAQSLKNFQGYGDRPEYQQLLQDLDAQHQAALENQKASVSDTERLLQEHLDRMNSKNRLDLSPLMSLVDTWTGSNMAKNYQRPTDSRADLETEAALQQGVQKARDAITDNEAQYLASKAGLLQRADDTKAGLLKALLGSETSQSLAKEKLAAKQAEAGGLNLTPGQKSMDVKFASDANEWSSAGRNNVESSLKSLETARSELERSRNDLLTTGKIAGSLPELFRTGKSLKIQQDVNKAMVNGIRAALGSNFTERENATIQKLSYDPSLSVDANLEKINSAIQKIRSDAANSEAKYQYFTNNNGTLLGYKGPGQQPAPQDPVTSGVKPMTREEKIKLLQSRKAGG